MAWTTEKDKIGNTCEVRISPHEAIIPNLGGVELAEAIARVTPYAVNDDTRPVLRCVRFSQKDGKTILECADGFRCAKATLEVEAGEGEVLIDAAELKPLTSVIRKARRVRLTLNGALEIATEATSYTLESRGGSFPNLEQVMPKAFQAQAQFDTREMRKAAASVNALSLDKQAAILVTVADGKLRLTPKDDTEGEAEVPAVTEGEATTALNCAWLLQALRDLGGMAEIKVGKASAPVALTLNGYRVLLMPVGISELKQAKAEAVAEAEAVVSGQPKCAVCGKLCKSERGLTLHMRTHAEAVGEAQGEGEAEPTDAELVEASSVLSQ